MKSQTKNSKNHTNGVRKSQQRKGGQRPPQPNTNQGKGSRASMSLAPVSIGNRTFSSKPRYRNLGENLIVSHNEYIGDITGSSTPFLVTRSLALNPGFFPWLSNIAARYESYKFLKLNFRFLTERPTTEPGYIALVPDYDPQDPAPSSKANAFQYESTAKSAPWENVTCISTQRNLNKRRTYFVRTTATSEVGELPLSDTGNLFVCVGGNSGAVILGELWCDYEVMFETPQIDPTTNVTTDSLLAVGGGTLTPGNPMGTAPLLTFAGSSGSFCTIDSASRLTFQIPYRGLFSYSVTGIGITNTSFFVSTVAITNASETTDNATVEGKFVFFATPGTFIDFSVTATTITAANYRFGRYSSS